MASNQQEEQIEDCIPDDVLFGPEVNQEHYNSCDEDNDEQLLVIESSEEDYRDIRRVWEMERGVQSIPNSDENSDENGAKNQNEAEEEDDDGEYEKPRPKTSIADSYFKKERLVWFSFDVETIKSGVVQISCTCTRFSPSGEPEKIQEEFNKYVNPGDNAIWDERSCRVHGLHEHDSRIQNAEDIESVWLQFCDYVNHHIGKSQRGVLVAWRGESCDMTWVYKLCQAPFSKLSLPDRLTFFMDPSSVIQTYKSCKLNHQRTGNDTYALGEVWKVVTKKDELEKAHDAIVDCRAQMDVLCSKEFKAYLNKTNSIKTIAEIISKKEQNELKKDTESIRPVHKPWKELLNPFSWTPNKEDSYSGHSGSGQAGPSNSITTLIATTTSLAVIFFAFFRCQSLRRLHVRQSDMHMKIM